MKEYLRKKFIGWLVYDLFRALRPEDILRFTEKGMFYKGHKLERDQVDEIVDDADRFKNSVIWKMLSDDAIYNANYIMFEKSKNFEEMMFGRAVLYAVDIISKRLEQLSNLKGKK